MFYELRSIDDYMKKKIHSVFKRIFVFSIRDTIILIVTLMITTLICYFIHSVSIENMDVSMLFILAIAIISRFTTGFFYGLFSCFIAIICDNYIFSYPYYTLNFSLDTYPAYFFSMFVVSTIICTMTSQLKEKENLEFESKTVKMRANLLLAISHDLRTPLTSIIGASSAILENYDRTTKEQKIELLSEVKEESEWLIRMVENLLFITKMQDNANTRITKRPEIAEEILSESVAKAKKRYPNAPIHIEIPPEIILVPMDAMLIEQVIINLLENAIRHSETATKIMLVLRQYENHAEFEVCDDGIGIPANIMPHLFDGLARTLKGGRIDTAKDMGIGLSVCHSIILAHDGTMEACNNPFGGARFIFRLPLEEKSYE